MASQQAGSNANGSPPSNRIRFIDTLRQNLAAFKRTHPNGEWECYLRRGNGETIIITESTLNDRHFLERFGQRPSFVHRIPRPVPLPISAPNVPQAANSSSQSTSSHNGQTQKSPSESLKEAIGSMSAQPTLLPNPAKLNLMRQQSISASALAGQQIGVQQTLAAHSLPSTSQAPSPSSMIQQSSATTNQCQHQSKRHSSNLQDWVTLVEQTLLSSTASTFSNSSAKSSQIADIIERNKLRIRAYWEAVKNTTNSGRVANAFQLESFTAFGQSYYTCVHCHDQIISQFFPEAESESGDDANVASTLSFNNNSEKHKHRDATVEDRLKADKRLQRCNAQLTALLQAGNQIIAETGVQQLKDELKMMSNLKITFANKAIVKREIANLRQSIDRLQSWALDQDPEKFLRIPEPSLFALKLGMEQCSLTLAQNDSGKENQHETHCYQCHSPIGDQDALGCPCCFRIWHRKCAHANTSYYPIPSCEPASGKDFPNVIYKFRPFASHRYQCSVCYTEEYGVQLALTFGSYTTGYRKATPPKALHYLVAYQLLVLNCQVPHTAESCMWKIDYTRALQRQPGTRIGRRMDLKTIWMNRAKYKCMEMLDCDLKLIIHNVNVLFPKSAVWKQHIEWLKSEYPRQLELISRCESCYCKSWECADSGFTAVCETPHTIVWARVLGLWWPAKVFEQRDPGTFATKRNEFQVVCFGKQMRDSEEFKTIKCKAADLRLYSTKPPKVLPHSISLQEELESRSKGIQSAHKQAMAELAEYIANLNVHYRYPAFPKVAQLFHYDELYNQYIIPQFWFRGRLVPSGKALNKLTKAQRNGTLPVDFDQMPPANLEQYIQQLMSPSAQFSNAKQPQASTSDVIRP